MFPAFHVNDENTGIVSVKCMNYEEAIAKWKKS